MILTNNGLFAGAAAAGDAAVSCGPASVSAGVTVNDAGVFLLRCVPANIFIDLPIPDLMHPLPSSPAAPVPFSLSSRLLINQELLSKEPEEKEAGAPLRVRPSSLQLFEI